MEAAEFTSPPSQPWPPRTGQRFFLLWLGIKLAGWIAFRAIGFTVAWTAGPAAWTQTYLVNAIPAVALGLAEGWLLFLRGPRMIAWTLLPVAHVAIPYLISRGNVGATWARYQGLT